MLASPQPDPHLVDYISAFGTLGAALVALGFGAWAEIRYLCERRARREEQERAQAARVSAWLTTLESQSDVPVVQAFVQNASEEPIWDVRVQIPIETGSVPDVLEQWEHAVLPPHTTKESDPKTLRPSPGIPLLIAFRDNNDRTWTRTEAGRLTLTKKV